MVAVADVEREVADGEQGDEHQGEARAREDGEERARPALDAGRLLHPLLPQRRRYAGVGSTTTRRLPPALTFPIAYQR